MQILSNPSDYTSENSVKIWEKVNYETLPEISKLIRQHKWAFVNRSNSTAPITAWAIDIQGMGQVSGRTDEELVNSMKKNWGRVSKEYPFVPTLWSSIQQLVPEYCLDLKRVFINGHTYGLGDSIHDDSAVPGITFIYYFNKVWHPEWGGHTLIYGSKKQIIATIQPQPARLLAFDARLFHKGEAPNRCCTDLRCTLAFHTRIRENNNAE